MHDYFLQHAEYKIIVDSERVTTYCSEVVDNVFYYFSK